MRLKLIDDAGMEYPKVVNTETGEKVDDILSIEYRASAFGRTIVIELIGEVELQADFKEARKADDVMRAEVRSQP